MIWRTSHVGLTHPAPSGWRVVFSAVICNGSQESTLALLASPVASRRSSIEKRTMMVSNAGESGEYGHQDDRFSGGNFGDHGGANGEKF